MKRYFYTLIGLLLAVSISFAQKGSGQLSDRPSEGKITGFVIEKESGNPIEFANIVIYSLRDSSIVSGGITDKTGYFSIDKIRYGQFFVEVNFIGYGKKTINQLSIKPDKKEIDLGKISLSLDAEMLSEVEISENVNEIDYRLDRKVITVNQDVTSAGESAVELLENAPSISTDIDGNVSLRGTESFLVMVDGRPSPIQGSEALQQIPANTIESIEIITNPSAKYDPDGVGGIINVNLIKEKRKGYNGQVSVKYGTFNALGGNALFNYRTNKVNFFIGGDYGERINQASSQSNRETFMSGDTSFFLNSYGDMQRGRKSGSARAGIDYYINDNEILTLSGRYGISGFGMDNNSWVGSYYMGSNNIYDSYYYLNDNHFEANRSYFSGDLNYMKKFKKAGHEVQIYGNFSNDLEDETNEYSEQETDYIRLPLNDTINNYRTLESGKGNTITGKIDYVLPLFKKAKLEAGYQTKYSLQDNDYDYQSMRNTIWIDDTSKSNPYYFSKNIQSGYVIYSDFIGSFGYQLGLRTEYTDRLFHQTLTEQEWQYNKFDFFPSVHLSYELMSDIQFMASYSRRLDRPHSYFLDPFREVISPNSVKQGNPLILPEYTNSFELGLQKKFKKNFISLEAYARQTNNKIERITMVDPDDQSIFIYTFDNIGSDLSIGSEIMTNLNLTSWYNLNISGTGYYYEITSDEYASNSTVTWYARIKNTFKLKKIGTSFQLGGFYRGASVTSQGEYAPMFMSYAGVRQDFFDRKLSIGLNVRDIFQTMQRETTYSTDEFYLYSLKQRKSPTFNISVTYKINDFKSRRDKGFVEGAEGEDEEM